MKITFVFMLLFSGPMLFSETIILSDGAKIEGEFEGVVDNVYMVRTKYGILNVKKDEILSPQDIRIKSEESPAEESVEVSTGTEMTEPLPMNAPAEPAENVYEYRVFNDTEGIKKVFYENGIAIATQSFNMKNEPLLSEGAVKDGKYSEYYPDGKIKAEKEFAAGKENGTAKIYYPSGTLQNRADFKNGLLDGPVFIYSPEGKLLFEQNYKDGILEGWVREYTPEGAVKNQTLYSSGAPAVIAREKSAAEDVRQINKRKIEINDSPVTAKKIDLARGEKYIVYFEKKQKAILIIDKDFNVISRSGKLPDGLLKIMNKEELLEKEFTFKNNRIESLRIFNPDGSEKDNYLYNKEGLAVRK